jgi:hypothetical protein
MVSRRRHRENTERAPLASSAWPVSATFTELVMACQVPAVIGAPASKL